MNPTDLLKLIKEVKGAVNEVNAALGNDTTDDVGVFEAVILTVVGLDVIGYDLIKRDVA